MYDTGILEELKDVIFRRGDEAESRTGSFADWSDRLLEWGARIPGRALWREMKDGARLPFLPGRAGTETLAIWLNEMARKGGKRLKIHICGHSTGAILLARLLESMEDLGPTLRIRSCSLFAPAATVGLFESHYYPYLVSPADSYGIEQMKLFNLNDRLERDDTVGHVYRKSLLYLVSRGFEEQVPEAILGMQKHVDELLAKPKMTDVMDRFSVHYADGMPSELTESSTHGGFDNDVATMNSLLRTILGKEPEHRFSKEILDY
jgi:pimeloyl-ACP methyl ester carboxylesterase